MSNYDYSYVNCFLKKKNAIQVWITYKKKVYTLVYKNKNVIKFSFVDVFTLTNLLVTFLITVSFVSNKENNIDDIFTYQNKNLLYCFIIISNK